MARTELTGKQIKNQSVVLTEDVTGVLPVANGGSGSDTLPLNNVLLGNGSGALQAVAPGAAGYVLTSDGTTWVSAAPTGASGSPAAGASGQRGSVWYQDDAAPGTIEGQLDGDYFLNTANGDVYQRQAGSWVLVGNLTGPQGASGSPGADGASGAPGATGAAGTDGASGAKGDQGDPGPAGADGASGPPGADGASGADGAVGATGPEGPAGPAGATGEKGDPGDPGADALWNFTGAYSGGAAYAVGDVATHDGRTWYRINANGGNVGDTPTEGTFWTLIAEKGDTGASGEPGAPGADGATGGTGAAGPSGAPGPSTVADDVLTVQNATDSTKQLRFSAASISTGTTRTLTVPNVSSTIEVTANKGVANGYAGLDSSARVPIAQLPPGLAVDSVTRTDGYIQFFSGATPVGSPIYLDLDIIDGGTASSSSVNTFDGGTP